MLTVYYNIYYDNYTTIPLNSRQTSVYKMKNYNINRLEEVSLDIETLEVEDTFIISNIEFKLENFNFQSESVDQLNTYYPNSQLIDYSFERTDCKKLEIIENNSIKFGCFCLRYTDPEEIYILFDKINKKYLIENLQSKFYIENLKDLLQYKNVIDPNRKEVKELFYKVLVHYQDNKDHILPFIKENLDDWWMRNLLFTNFNFTNLDNIQTLVESKKEEIRVYNFIMQSTYKNTDLVIDDIVKFVIKVYI